MWSCADNTLIRIDPATNEADLETGLEMRSGPWSIGGGAVAVVDGPVWASSDDSDSIVRLAT